ncbi:dephospho-CoA kinase [Rhizobium wenxiniae]|jgi:dephospho-CoA kinase|uniref:dephospho-CoA kinase n=1 Tax=Rhizobium wenxiniae TaxID=1737357 RepID=UPI003C1653A0
MIVIGLTGSIGMGKTTTAGMFGDAGIPVNDSDAVVHDLYKTDAVKPVGEAFPGSIREGAIDRVELARQLSLDPGGFSRLEAIVHPLVRDREKQFLERQRSAGADLVLLDIPLLFETGAEKRVDVVVVATCDPQIQRQRVLARPGMTEEKFKLILNRQLPDSQKREHADFLVDTGCGLDQAKKRVEQIINLLRSGIRSEKHA